MILDREIDLMFILHFLFYIHSNKWEEILVIT